MAKNTCENKYCIHISSIIAILVIAIALSVLIGWIFKLTFLTTIIPTAPSMKVSTASCMLLSGLALLCYSLNKIRTKGQTAIRYEYITFLASSFILIMVLILVSLPLLDSFIVDESRFNQIFANQAAGLSNLKYIGIPSLGTAVAFILFSVLMFFSVFNIITKKTKLILASTILIMGCIALLGHMTGYALLYYQFKFWNTGMAINTTLAFILLSIGYIIGERYHGSY